MARTPKQSAKARIAPRGWDEVLPVLVGLPKDGLERRKQLGVEAIDD